MNPVVYQYATFGLGAAVIAFMAFLFYDRREKRRKHALELVDAFNKLGLDWLANVLKLYAVGDYSGIAQEVRAIIRDLHGDGIVQRFECVFWHILEKYRDDPVKVGKILKALDLANPDKVDALIKSGGIDLPKAITAMRADLEKAQAALASVTKVA